MMVAALFVRKDSIYKSMPGVDAWDKHRDARTWPGGDTIVAHPPCAQWCALSHFANDIPEQKALGPLAVELVRKWGGVLEHPAFSKLWSHCHLPRHGFDSHGGWTFPVDQYWFGHRARKRTFLYIVGMKPRDLPPVLLQLGRAPTTVTTSRRKDKRGGVEMTAHSEREKTPRAFAEWLIEIARRCSTAAKASEHG